MGGMVGGDLSRREISEWVGWIETIKRKEKQSNEWLY